ncbi:MAG: hypothetical protein PHX18_03890 [Candidatus Gastranaerophilales bacterium]|nr:hypothetical protein [Candidatus Gastranaerophilales bacterium]
MIDAINANFSYHRGSRGGRVSRNGMFSRNGGNDIVSRGGNDMVRNGGGKIVSRGGNDMVRNGGGISFMRADTAVAQLQSGGSGGETKDNLKSLAFVGGCAAAVSLVADALINMKAFLKLDTSLLKSMFKNAGIWAGIGGLCFGFFKIVERISFAGDYNEG